MTHLCQFDVCPVVHILIYVRIISQKIDDNNLTLKILLDTFCFRILLIDLISQ